MSHRYDLSQSGIYLTALTLILLSGCASISMTSSKEELQGLEENEGIVVGSVLLTVAKGDADESWWAFLGGRKADELEYSISISETDKVFKPIYGVAALPGKEEVFIKKLPVGSYNMNSLRPAGGFAPRLSLPLTINFNVKPRQTTYIGKLVVNFPDRIKMGSRVPVVILDAQEETIEKLRGEHSSIVLNTVKELATSITETFVAPRYSISADNNVAIKALGVGEIGVSEFTGPETFDATCRGFAPLGVPDRMTHAQYIRKAFEDELRTAGVFADKAPRVILSGTVTRLEVSSSRGVTGGEWIIDLTVRSNNGSSMTATENYQFRSGFAGFAACKQTAEAFAPAVQNLIGRIARSSEFRALVR